MFLLNYRSRVGIGRPDEANRTVIGYPSITVFVLLKVNKPKLAWLPLSRGFHLVLFNRGFAAHSGV